MKILNLVDLEKSEIKYKKVRYPDLQQNIIIESGKWNYQDNVIVQIKSRLNSFQDLESIICTVKSLRELGIKEIHLYTPAFLGQRSDRKFEEGSCNYLKDVICPIINSLKFDSVTCLDPHSDVLEACLNNFKKIDNLELVKYAINEIYIEPLLKTAKSGDTFFTSESYKNFILVSPDAGASHKIYKLAEQIGYKGDIITCSKERDTGGKLMLCNVPIKEEQLKKDIVLIDDIFDFGGTFKNIAATLNDAGHFGKKYLIVTHSIQTKGLEDALKYFDVIYTTNSYKEHNLEKVKQLNVF